MAARLAIPLPKCPDPGETGPVSQTGRIPLSAEERATYGWQIPVPGFGEAGQQRLRDASVLVSRVGGLGGVVAYELAAAGVGRLVLAHAGNIRPSDLNRQILMTHAALGTPRIESAARRLKELNPRLEVVAVGENVDEGNAAGLVGQADLVVDCAPLFEERFAMNREAVHQGKPLVESAMYGLEANLTTMIPGRTPCVACLYPEAPPAWRREFPVFGAVAGGIGCMAAMEAIKVIAGFGDVLAGRMMSYDLRDMTFAVYRIKRRMNCPICGPY
jgi:molybdopterin/thiamine biosynthesis adenylyltransferase